MKHGRFCILAVALFTATTIPANAGIQGQTDVSGGVPKNLLRRLGPGVNITRWFCYQGASVDTKHFASYFTAADFQALRRLHVTWVRLCVSPDVIYTKGSVNRTTLPFLDDALIKLKRSGIAVVVDLHDNGQLKLDAEGRDTSDFVQFWSEMARHYKGKDETQVVFELLNEPVFNHNPKTWFALQQKTVRAIRTIDPKRTIMVSGTSWSGIDAMLDLPVLPERNLIYTYHCYDPMTFTHQGASWVGDELRNMKNVPFPASEAAVESVIGDIPAQYQNSLRWYGKQPYNASYLRDRLKKASAWGSEHHVPLVLGEFGAYPPVSPVASRRNWFMAMKAAIDAVKVPYAIWGYDDALGLGRSLNPNGSLHLDAISSETVFSK